jgi:hypothetical protein
MTLTWSSQLQGRTEVEEVRAPHVGAKLEMASDGEHFLTALPANSLAQERGLGKN